ncbi:MAG: RelA/SpoT family protein [Methylocystaceae bacterium]
MEPDELISAIAEYNPHGDILLVSRAFIFAREAHHLQLRNSGEPYIIHPLAVAHILTELELDAITISAALLHDVVEDTDATLEDLIAEFGEEVAFLVDGVTKLSRLEFKTKEEAQAENLRKMFFAMAQDIRVVLIKLADRLHNMRTLSHQPPDKQKEIARETLEIFAPLAHRLGIFRFKWELEDLSFRYLEPEMYFAIASRLKVKRTEREDYVTHLVEQIKEALVGTDIVADIEGRPKNLYSIYKKMIKQNKDLDEIYDKIAIRVIVDNVRDCYAVLGTIHTLWTPLPGRFKDYIAMPKPNMYQSLHTTLIGKGGEPFEVQIRTWEMHRTAEYGIAAHWKYKEGVQGDREFEEKLVWLRRILEWQQDVKDTHEFMDTLRIDLFADTVFVFTPKGDVVELPKGACPLDFAYRVHTEVGHRCVGARVNGRIVPLDYTLNNSDIVEIMTSKQSPGPSRDWLNFVRTSQAKSRIKQYFKREKRQDFIIRGRDLLEAELKRNNLDVKELMKEENLLKVAQRLNLKQVDDVFSAIGDGTVTALQVTNRLKEEFFRQTKVDELIEGQILLEQRKKSSQLVGGTTIRVKGVDNVVVRLSRCCNPLPGDAITGYITRGKGVSVHRLDCPNFVGHLSHEVERIVEVEWADQQNGSYLVELEIVAYNRARLTTDIMNTVADAHININSVFSRASKTNQALINLKLEIKDLSQLQAVMQRITKVKDVTEVRRVVPR